MRRATFQRMINKTFAKHIGKNIEANMDDMVIKSKKVDEHVKDLEEVFGLLRKIGVKLNPKKCMFGVQQENL